MPCSVMSLDPSLVTRNMDYFIREEFSPVSEDYNPIYIHVHLLFPKPKPKQPITQTVYINTPIRMMKSNNWRKMNVHRLTQSVKLASAKVKNKCISSGP